MAQSTSEGPDDPEPAGEREHSSPHGETDYSPASLLRALTANPLDVEQLRGTDIPHDEATPPDSGPMRAWTLVMAVALGLLVAVSVTQLRAGAAADDSPRALLVERIQERQERIDALEDEQEGTEGEIADLQEELLVPGDEVGAEQLATYEAASGTTALAGPGVQIVLEDSAPLAAVPGAADGVVNRVSDSDLQLVVNGLWESGAEAIAINGQRVTATTAIRTAGDAVLVDFRPLSPPYTIMALGDPVAMQEAYSGSEADRFIDQLGTSYGIGSSWTAADELTVPARAHGTLEEAAPLEEGRTERTDG